MDDPNPFAEMPATPEPMIAQGREALAHEVAARRAVPSVDLAQLATEAVRSLWDKPIKTFIPLLAFRQAGAALPPARPSDESMNDQLASPPMGRQATH